MMRYFFDYKAKDQSLYDYRGEEFPSTNGALEFAQEMVQSLKHSLNDNWTGWSVEVRGADGRKFFALPVEGSGLLAA